MKASVSNGRPCRTNLQTAKRLQSVWFKLPLTSSPPHLLTPHPVPKLIPHLSALSVRAERTSNGDLWCTACLWVNISGVGDCQQAERTSCGTVRAQHAEGTVAWGGGCSDLCQACAAAENINIYIEGSSTRTLQCHMFSFRCRNISDQVQPLVWCLRFAFAEPLQLFWFGLFPSEWLLSAEQQICYLSII